MQSLDEFATAKLGELDRQSLRRSLVDTTRVTGIWVLRNGRRLLSFSCNDYLNLTHHPAVKEAAIQALRIHGVGAGASRLVTGNHPLYAELEARLARWKGTEAACVFGSGYLANTGIIPVLAGAQDIVLMDELVHACLWAGARQSGASVMTYRHCDVEHAEALLAEHRGRHRHALLITDGVFSMDGDIAPLYELSALARRHDAWLLSDDAHGLGVLGHGHGSFVSQGTPADIPLQMGTLSKALGSYGGYLCASAAVIDLMRNRARTLIYSTGLPPATVASAIAALDVIEHEPDYAALPVIKAKAFARDAGVPEPVSPIVPLVLGDAQAALEASQLLEEQGFLVAAIRPPTVPEGTARLRLTFTAQHPEAEIARLAKVVRDRILVPGDVSAIFVTATGTEIGKTFVTAGLIRHYRKAGGAVDAIKPVMTGFSDEAFQDCDAAVLLAVLGRPVAMPEIEQIAPWRFTAPLSPDMAARLEARAIDFDELVEFSRSAMARRSGVLLIEGIGGVMVPLDDRRTVLDWMSVLRIPVVLVAGTYVGTLSHTLTALEVVARRNIDIAAVVVNESGQSAASLADTIATLQQFTGSIDIVGLPRLPAGADDHPAFADLARLLG